MSQKAADQRESETSKTGLEAIVAVLAMAALQLLVWILSLNNGWAVGGRGAWVWLFPILPEVLIAAVVATQGSHLESDQTGRRRAVAVGLTSVVSILNTIILLRVVFELFAGGKASASELAVAATVVWLTLVVSTAMLYWELDGGGPERRILKPDGQRDFLFSEMTAVKLVPLNWRPSLIDYGFLSLTTAICWSAADVQPISRGAKALMAYETTISALTILGIVARAANG